MTDQPPPIDPRTRADLVAQTTALAAAYSGWRPRPDGRPDPGVALVGVLARFAELVVQRVNRSLDRNYLAFLDLIGTRPVPPLPARVPLTFSLAEGSPVGALVPAGTQVSAAPAGNATGEVVFETETTLVVTPARLQAVIVGDAENDRYADRSGEPADAFAVFDGDVPIPHQWFIASDPQLTRPGAKDVTVVVRSPQAALLDRLPISWAYRNDAGWEPLTATTTVRDGAWTVTLPAVPQLAPAEVGGVVAGWIRAQLDRGLPRGRSGLPPTAVAVGARPPQEEIAGVSPFGDEGQPRRFYLSVDEPVATGGAVATLTVGLARPGVVRDPAAPVRLVWSYKVGSDWKPLGRSTSRADQAGAADAELRDGTRALTGDGVVSFRVPSRWPREVFQGRYGRWLRVEVADDGGSYAQAPQFATLTAGYGWELPAVTGIAVGADAPPESVPPPAAFANGTPLDLSRACYPFGEQPRFNDTFFLSCPPSVARPGETVALDVTLLNVGDGSPVPVVRTDGQPQLAWDAWAGAGWVPVRVAPADYVFTTTDTVRITLPPGFGPSEVGGDTRYWLRVRLVGGDYGRPASYQRRDGGEGYDLIPATFAPPVISALSWTSAGGSATVPASACVTGNDFQFRTHGPDEHGVLPEFQPFRVAGEADSALYLGFDRPFETRPVTLYLQVEPPDPAEVTADRLVELDPADRADLAWEYHGSTGWQPLAAIDETQALAVRGTMRFVGPPDPVVTDCFGRSGYWLRLRLRRGGFPVGPRLYRVRANTTWATQATTVTDEVLGSGTAEPGQRFGTAQAPVLAGEQLTVREDPDEPWVPWAAVADFNRSGPDDRHYTVDPRTGQVGFGDGQAGRLVPRGQNNVRITYRTGGGLAGNRSNGTITTLKSAVPYVDAVTNHEDAGGGSDWEPLDRLRVRGPRALRHRDRAVTAEDVEDIALESSPAVALARAVVPSQYDPLDLWRDPAAPAPADVAVVPDAGRVGLIVVPNSADARPTPSLGLLREVQAYVRARCCATATLWVAGPEWVRVTVTATVAPLSPDIGELVRARVTAALDRFLHPLTGGQDGSGWAFGREPHPSDLFALVEAVDGVDHVSSLTVAQRAESDDLGDRLAAVLGRSLADAAAQPPPAGDLLRWLSRALVYSGPHQITVTL